MVFTLKMIFWFSFFQLFIHFFFSFVHLMHCFWMIHMSNCGWNYISPWQLWHIPFMNWWMCARHNWMMGMGTHFRTSIHYGSYCIFVLRSSTNENVKNFSQFFQFNFTSLTSLLLLLLFLFFFFTYFYLNSFQLSNRI